MELCGARHAGGRGAIVFLGTKPGRLECVQASYSAGTWGAIMDYVNAHPGEYRGGLSAANIDRVKNVTAFEILKKRKASGGVYLTVQRDGGITLPQGKPFVSESFFRNIGGEWKIATPGESGAKY